MNALHLHMFVWGLFPLSFPENEEKKVILHFYVQLLTPICAYLGVYALGASWDGSREQLGKYR